MLELFLAILSKYMTIYEKSFQTSYVIIKPQSILSDGGEIFIISLTLNKLGKG